MPDLAEALAPRHDSAIRPADGTPLPAIPGRSDHTAMRGMLILAVLLDHNDIVRNVHAVNAWFLPMTFHVAGFLLLPFLAPARPLSVPMARDHAVRYLVPFLFALLTYAAAFQFLAMRLPPDAAWAGHVVRAFLLADPWSLKLATGFIVLWFLPALLCMVLLAAACVRAPRLRPMLLAVALGVHLGVGAAPQAFKGAVPQGLLIALYLFPLGLVVRQAAPWLLRRSGLWVVPVAACVLLACWRFELGHEVEVATLVLPTWRQPLWVIATDCSDLSFLAILASCASKLARVPGLVVLGRYSLMVYLIHPLVYKPVLAVLLRFCMPALLASPVGMALYWTGAAASVVVAGGVSLALAALVQAWSPLRSLVTPRGLWDWAPVAALS